MSSRWRIYTKIKTYQGLPVTQSLYFTGSCPNHLFHWQWCEGRRDKEFHVQTPEILSGSFTQDMSVTPGSKEELSMLLLSSFGKNQSFLRETHSNRLRWESYLLPQPQW